MAVPSEIIAGDSYTWTAALVTAGERATFCFRDGDGSGINCAGVLSGSTHAFTLKISDTAQLKQGWYDVSDVREKADGTRVTTQNITRTRVIPDPIALPVESENQRRLRELRTAYDKRVAGGMIDNKSVAGVSVSKIPMPELQSMIERYEIRVRREKAAGRMARGRESGSNLKVKF